MSRDMQHEFDANFHPMKEEDILKALHCLARSQGHYSRILEDLHEMEEYDYNEYEQTMAALEAEEFIDLLELVEFYEEGKHTSRYYANLAAQGYRIYTVEVERSIRSKTRVLAKSVDEAKHQAKIVTSPGVCGEEDEATITSCRFTEASRAIDVDDEKILDSINKKILVDEAP